MVKPGKSKADQHDHDNHLPKDILNLKQDSNSFRDPLKQQIEKHKASNSAVGKENRDRPSEEDNSGLRE